MKAKSLAYDTSRNKDTPGQPELKDMVKKAISILEKDSDGFFLMVEGTFTIQEKNKCSQIIHKVFQIFYECATYI